MNWYYWIIIFGFMFVMLFFMKRKQSKQEQAMRDAVNALQVGDRVFTHIGIFGRIKKIYETTYGKVCVLEVGTNQKIDIEMDIRVIAGKDEKTLVVAEEPKVTQEKIEEPKVAQEKVEEPKQIEETKEEKTERKKKKKKK